MVMMDYSLNSNRITFLMFFLWICSPKLSIYKKITSSIMIGFDVKTTSSPKWFPKNGMWPRGLNSSSHRLCEISWDPINHLKPIKWIKYIVEVSWFLVCKGCANAKDFSRFLVLQVMWMCWACYFKCFILDYMGWFTFQERPYGMHNICFNNGFQNVTAWWN